MLRSPPVPGTLDRMEALWLSLLFGAPWLVAIAWVSSQAPRMDAVPPSMAARMRQRLAWS
jgi:hypothetical protein